MAKSDLAGKLSDWFFGDKPKKGESAEDAKKRRAARRKKRSSGNRNQRKQLEKLEY